MKLIADEKYWEAWIKRTFRHTDVLRPDKFPCFAYTGTKLELCYLYQKDLKEMWGTLKKELAKMADPNDQPVDEKVSTREGKMIEFNRGYACAVSCIVQGHGEDTCTREALSANGMSTRKKAEEMGVDEYDLNVLWPPKKDK